VVQVATEAGTVEYEVLAIGDMADAANTAAPGDRPSEGLGSSPDDRTSAELTVRIGDVVHIRDGQLHEWWRIVPDGMSDALRRWISADTPMARALLGHRVGEQVRVERPGGRWPVTILAVESAVLE
jgi:transcription elongation GreA/GreB family factor